jgi:hypothetical protein
LKKSTIEYRRGKATRSPWAKKSKSKYAYPTWVTRPNLAEPAGRVPDAVVTALQANLLIVFPRLATMPREKLVPHWLWNWKPRQAA